MTTPMTPKEWIKNNEDVLEECPDCVGSGMVEGLCICDHCGDEHLDTDAICEACDGTGYMLGDEVEITYERQKEKDLEKLKAWRQSNENAEN